METFDERRINYSSRKRKKILIAKFKKLVLIGLLVGTLGVNASVEIVDNVKDSYHYYQESKPYEQMVNEHFYHVVGTNNMALDTFELAQNFKKIDTFKNKDDVYHGLIECA